MPNNFAYFMLIFWAALALYLFRRLNPLQATLWTLVAGYMLLPEKSGAVLDFPLIPPLDKESIPALSALAGCYFVAKQKVPLLPRSGAAKWLMIIMLLSPMITTITNQESFRLIPGMNFYDAFSFTAATYLRFIPFLLGLHLVKTHDDQVLVLKWLVVAGLAYSALALYEIRMSPQLHRAAYGFFPHDWRQQIRFGGFRAVVFMRHGLVVSMFFAITAMSAIILWKNKYGFYKSDDATRRFTIWAVVYLLIVLVLCKSVGTIFYGFAFLLIAIYMPTHIMRLTTLGIIGIVMTYPMLSIMGLFPHEQLVNLAGTYINDLRAQSLQFRFTNEDILLTHAKDKLLFGWGLWGRNRPGPGVVTDGTWIIFLGSVGLVGFLANFGIAALSITQGIKAAGKLTKKHEKNILLFLSLIASIIMLDQIPNSSLSSYMWLIIGGLLGRARYILNKEKVIPSKSHLNLSNPRLTTSRPLQL